MRALLTAVMLMSACARGTTPAYGIASVDDADHAITAGWWHPVDANTAATRRRSGTLPGAVLLGDPAAYEAAELPVDLNTTLVFYCSDEACTASHDAANRAVAFGYSNVWVMPAGIAGWVKAGKPVQRR